MLHYLRDIFDLTQSLDFDEGVFQVYQAIGRSMCAQAIDNRSPQGYVVYIAQELSSQLDAFNNAWQLSSGLGMENLWAAFRPPTAKDFAELRFSLQLRDLATHFDALRWDSGASVRELDSVQMSIVRVHDALGDSSAQDLSPLEVPLSLVDQGASLTCRRTYSRLFRASKAAQT